MALITTDYGKDTRIGKVVGTSSGLRNLIEALSRRLSTAKGSLFYDPEYGEDLRLYLNQEMTADVLDAIKVAIEQQLERDERVQEARCKVVFNSQAFSLKINITVTPFIGKTFTLVLSVDKLSVQLLEDSLNQ